MPMWEVWIEICKWKRPVSEFDICGFIKIDKNKNKNDKNTINTYRYKKIKIKITKIIHIKIINISSNDKIVKLSNVCIYIGIQKGLSIYSRIYVLKKQFPPQPGTKIFAKSGA
jgi:hypothetical protein